MIFSIQLVWYRQSTQQYGRAKKANLVRESDKTMQNTTDNNTTTVICENDYNKSLALKISLIISAGTYGIIPTY